jgi:hypothetical protein
VLGQKGDIGVTSQNGDRGCRVRREIGVPSQREKRFLGSEEKYGAWSAGREGCLGIL